MSEKVKPYAMLCFKCPHCNGIIHAELFKARIDVNIADNYKVRKSDG